VLLLVTAAVSADFERWLDEGRSGNYPGVRLSPDSYVELASVSVRHDPPQPREPSPMDSQPTTLGPEPLSAHDRGAASSPQAKPVGTELARMDHPGEVQAVALSPDGTQFATVCGRTVFLREVATRQVTELNLRAKPNVIRMLRRAAAGICSVAFSQDGTRLAAVIGNSASVWQVATRQELGQYHAEPLAAGAVSLDIDMLAIAAGNSAWIWDVVAPGNGREIEKIIAAGSVRPGSFKDLNHPAEVKAMAFSPDGVRLASVSGMTIRLWEVSSRRELVHVKGAGQLARTLAFSMDSTRLATASGGTAQVWDMTGREVARLKRGDDIRAMVFGSDGNCLTTIGGSTARLWDVTRRDVIWTVDIGDGPVAFSQDSSKLATASGTTIRMLEIAGSEMATVNAVGNVAAVALSPDGTRLATVTGTTAQAWAV